MRFLVFAKIGNLYCKYGTKLLKSVNFLVLFWLVILRQNNLCNYYLALFSDCRLFDEKVTSLPWNIHETKCFA